MARPRKTERKHEVRIQLSERLYARLVGHLYSEVDGRIPYSAISDMVAPLLEAELNRLYGEGASDASS